MGSMMNSGALMDLKSLIEFASTQAEKIFRRAGAISPMYHAIKASGEHAILTPREDDKDVAVAMVKAWFVLNDIDRYVFIDEAWILDTTKGGPPIDMAKVRREGLRNHPDRREVVMFAAENKRGEMLTAARFILRPEHGKAQLTPLKINDMTGVESSGRMVGLLNWEK
jgi:hypothetical protein